MQDPKIRAKNHKHWKPSAQVDRTEECQIAEAAALLKTMEGLVQSDFRSKPVKTPRLALC